jgi:hydroxymethylpyrimidine pyrophosphatase-like HAD family hydrolase
MIEFAGLGIVMENASARVKVATNYVTNTNDNNDIAKALNEILAYSIS